jgi:deazaflavin-dependent oxidoreductase (nitroreductase family)
MRLLLPQPRRDERPSPVVERLSDACRARKRTAIRKRAVAATGDPDTVKAMPSRFVLKSMNNIHKTLLAVSFGRIGWDAGKMPVLKLTTTGRKSGQKRLVMLTSPIQIGDTWVIVASKGGDDDHPAWFLNLQDNPTVEVDIRGKKTTRTARIATSVERSTLWPEITAKYANYGGYQNKTDREIPLVFLELNS